MALFNLFSRKDPWTTGDFPAPWPASSRSIFQHLKGLEDRGTNSNSQPLPDDDRINSGSEIRFAAGLSDALSGPDTANAQALADMLVKVVEFPSKEKIAKAYQIMTEHSAVGMVDGMIRALVEAKPDAQRLAIFARWLARNSPDRAPAKIGVAILGLFPGDQFTPLFLTFGRHEEFTKFAAVALQNSLGPREARAPLEQLARSVHGWGRIDLVERLAPDADAAFRHWLVREGFRNSIMNEYLAHTAAVHGQVLEQLRAPGATEDSALLDGAADIFTALASDLDHGPGANIYDYPDAPSAAQKWLDAIEPTAATLRRAAAALALKTFAERGPQDTEWPEDISTDIIARSAAYIARPEVQNAVLAALAPGDQPELWLALTLAPALDIDAWPHLFALQSAAPDAQHWFELAKSTDPDRLAQLIALAEAQLPLDAIASGPGTELGFGPDWSAHSDLAAILRGVSRVPGQGWPLIAASLQSPIPRNRVAAADTLRDWPPAVWPPEAVPLLQKAIAAEPHDLTKADLEALLTLSRRP